METSISALGKLMFKIEWILIRISLLLLGYICVGAELSAQNQVNKYKQTHLDDLILKIEFRLFKNELLDDVPALCDSIVYQADKSKDIYSKTYGIFLKGAAYTELKKYKDALYLFKHYDIDQYSPYLRNFKKYYLGVIYYRTNDLKKSLSNLNLAESYFEKDTANVKNRIILGFISKFKGRVFAESSVYSQAIEVYYKSISYFKSTPFKSNIYEVYRLIGRSYYMDSQYDPEFKYEALINYQKALSGFRKYKIMQELPWAYTLLADYYTQKNEPQLAKLYQDSCMVIAHSRNLPDLIGISYNNYGEIDMLQSKFDESITNFKRAIDYYQQANNISNRIVSLINISAAYLKLAMPDSAQKYSKQSLEIAIQFGNLEKIAKSYFSLSQIEIFKNNFKEAFFYHQKFKSYKDSVYLKQNMDIAYAMREIRKNEVKEKENLILKNENLKKEYEVKSANRFTIIIAILSIILILCGIFSFYNMKRRKEMQLQLETQQLLAEKFEIKEKTLKETEQELHVITNEIIIVTKSIKSKDSITSLTTEVEILESINKKMRNIQSGLKSPTEFAQYKIKLDSFLFQYKNVYAFNIIKDIDPGIIWDNVNMETQMHLYRITLLLLHNTNIHAKATEVGINCNLATNKLNFMYTDDGIGYNPENIPRDRGLAEIYSRLRYLQGTLLDESRENWGCQICIEIPVS